MTSKSNPKSGMNMTMIAAAVVVIIIIIVGAVALTGSKTKSAQGTTSIAQQNSGTTAPTTVPAGGSSASTTNPTTTVASSSGGSSTGSSTDFSSWVGQNLTLSQFAQDIGSSTYSKPTNVNATYDYESSIYTSAPYAFSFNVTGVTNVAKYNNDSRTTTTTNSSGQTETSILIYNATSKNEYTCSSTGTSSFSCFVAANVSSVNSSTDYVGSLASNSSIKGYINNITVTTSSHNGLACTLISGHLHISSQDANGTYAMDAQTSICVSTQYNTWLTQKLVGMITSSSQGYNASSNLNYTESEVSISSNNLLQ